MKTLHLAALPWLALACGGPTTDDVPTATGTAAAALRALVDRDVRAVERCSSVVDRCRLRSADAGAGAACERLAEHCVRLGERLETARGPAMGCLRRVEACELRAPEQARCGHASDVCESLQTDLEGKRDPLLACSERVQACLDRVGDGEVGGRACEAMADACERAEQRGLDDDDAGNADEGDDDDEANDELGRRGQAGKADAGPPAETPVARGRQR